MALKIYVMKFHQAHFGNGYLNSSIAHFTASRLFSALCLEAIKNNCLDEFIAEANQPDFVLSDAFPFIERPYLPKPVSYPNFDFAFESLDDNIQKQKLADSLYAVPLDEYHNFLQGRPYIDLAHKTHGHETEVLLTSQKHQHHIFRQNSEIFLSHLLHTLYL